MTFFKEVIIIDNFLLGSVIREKRLYLGMTLSDVCEKTGVSQSYLNRIETGKRVNPTIEVFVSISQVLDIDTNYLLHAAGLNPVYNGNMIDNDIETIAIMDKLHDIYPLNNNKEQLINVLLLILVELSNADIRKLIKKLSKKLTKT